MKRVVVEERVGGNIYTEQDDGSNCVWGGVVVWEPPHRFVMAWQITPEWQYEPDRAKCSEVEVRFTPVDDGSTLVELEHRHLERHGGNWPQMRASVNSDGGWGGLLKLFAAEAGEAGK